jgi:hypothetical protein
LEATWKETEVQVGIVLKWIKIGEAVNWLKTGSNREIYDTYELLGSITSREFLEKFKEEPVP